MLLLRRPSFPSATFPLFALLLLFFCIDTHARTIYESFVRKYTALSGMSVELIRSSHKFTPVTIGQTLRLRGAAFEFFYTLHSIPCIGFEVRVQSVPA